MSKTHAEPVFVNAPLHELLKHSRTVSNNMQAEQFEADRIEAAEKFGFTTEEKDDADENLQGDKPKAGKNGKRKGRSGTQAQAPVAERVSGEGDGSGGQAGPVGPVILNAEDGEKEEQDGAGGDSTGTEDGEQDGGGSADLEKNPWDA